MAYLLGRYATRGSWSRSDRPRRSKAPSPWRIRTSPCAAPRSSYTASEGRTNMVRLAHFARMQPNRDDLTWYDRTNMVQLLAVGTVLIRPGRVRCSLPRPGDMLRLGAAGLFGGDRTLYAHAPSRQRAAPPRCCLAPQRS